MLANRTKLTSSVTSYIQKNTSTAACFPGACVEKKQSTEFGSDGKDKWKKSKKASKTEISEQIVRLTERQSKPNRAHQGFRGETALAAHGR